MCTCHCMILHVIHVRTRQITIKGRQAKTACLATATWCWMKVCSHCTASHGNWNRGPAIYPGNPCSRSLSEHTRFRNKMRIFPGTSPKPEGCNRIWKDWNDCMRVWPDLQRVITSLYHSYSFVIIFVVCLFLLKLRKPSCCVFICPDDSRPQPWFALSCAA